MKDTRLKKKRQKGSVFDLFLAFLLLFSILGGYLRNRELRALSEKESLREYRLVAVVEGIDPRVADCLAEGEVVFNGAGEEWGRVLAGTRHPTKVSFLSGGQTMRGEWDVTRKCDLYVELAFQGSEVGGRILQNGRSALLAEQRLTLYSARTVLPLRILWVGELDAEK